ncbi:MAG TPA: carboxymuconolactone decarboxylase family protein [Bryobacteraceae bacterium]|nr:carboxymuconolactone decarboxylase family protein [Bryobacteraceae bacterium]
MYGLENYIRQSSGPEPLLLELIGLRTLRINACAYCMDTHSRDARAIG